MLKRTFTVAALAGLGAVMSGIACADGTMVGGGRTGDSKWIDIVGYAQVDQIWTASRNVDSSSIDLYDGSTHLLPGGSNLRRALLGVEGGLADGLTYRLRTNFTDPSVTIDVDAVPETVLLGSHIADAFVNYKMHDAVNLTMGQFDLPFGLEGATDNQNLMFFERGMASETFFSGPKMAVMVSSAWDDYNATLTGALFQGRDKTLTNSTYDSPYGAEPTAYFGRVTWAPEYDGTRVHMGVSGTHQPLGNPEIDVLYAAPSEMKLRSSEIFIFDLNEGEADYFHAHNRDGYALAYLSDIETVENAAFELGVQHGSLLVQGEFTYNNNKRDVINIEDPEDKEVKFRGYSLQAGYVLTGEMRPYNFKSGSFGRVNPRGKYGAWETTARFSMIDLHHHGEGAERNDTRNVTLGVNWFRNNAFNMGVNYVHHKVPTENGTLEADLVGLRAQFVF